MPRADVGGGGFHPEHSLPVVLDVGCNRKEMVQDAFYMVRPGLRVGARGGEAVQGRAG